MKNSVVLMVFPALLLIGCFAEPSQSDQIKKTEDKKKALAVFKEVFLKPKKEKLELLALKYKINQEKIEIVIKTYLDNHNNIDGLLPQEENRVLPKKSICETIKLLEKEQEIPSELLASMIIDYQMWHYIDNPSDMP